jgi:hypothetical protein
MVMHMKLCPYSCCACITSNLDTIHPFTRVLCEHVRFPCLLGQLKQECHATLILINHLMNYDHCIDAIQIESSQ